MDWEIKTTNLFTKNGQNELKLLLGGAVINARRSAK